MTQAITLNNQPIHCVEMLALDKMKTDVTARQKPTQRSGTAPLMYRRPRHLLFLEL